MWGIKKISACRLCGGKELKEVFSLGNLYVSTFLEKQKEGLKAPLTIVECQKCTLAQLQHSAPQELMYSKHYWYKSGNNKRIVYDLQDIVQQIGKFTRGNILDNWIDIGANDGTLLDMVPKRFIKIGFLMSMAKTNLACRTILTLSLGSLKTILIL